MHGTPFFQPSASFFSAGMLSIYWGTISGQMCGVSTSLLHCSVNLSFIGTPAPGDPSANERSLSTPAPADSSTSGEQPDTSSDSSSALADFWVAIVSGVVLIMLGGVMACFWKVVRDYFGRTIARLRGIEGESPPSVGNDP